MINDDNILSCLKYHASAGGEYTYRGNLAIEEYKQVRDALEEYSKVCLDIARFLGSRVCRTDSEELMLKRCRDAIDKEMGYNKEDI